MVPSSYEDVTSPMSGQPISRNYFGRHGYCFIVCFDFISELICILRSQPSFCLGRLSFVLWSFGCSLFGRLYGFKEFN